MKQAFHALKGGDWEEYKSIFRVQAKATEWAFDRKQEAFEKVAKDEARKLSTVQEGMEKYSLPAVHHRARQEQFSCGRLRLVGLSGEKAHQLVVCDLWRKI